MDAERRKKEEEEGLDMGEHHESAYCFTSESFLGFDRGYGGETPFYTRIKDPLKHRSKYNLKHVNAGKDLQKEEDSIGH